MVTKPQTAARQPSFSTARSFRSKDSSPTTILAKEAAAPNLLAQLSEWARQALLALDRQRDYAAGDLRYRQGDHHNGIYLTEEGLIRSYYHSENGRELTLGCWAVGGRSFETTFTGRCSLSQSGAQNRHRGPPLLEAPLPHHPACGSAPGGSRV